MRFASPRHKCSSHTSPRADGRTVLALVAAGAVRCASLRTLMMIDGAQRIAAAVATGGGDNWMLPPPVWPCRCAGYDFSGIQVVELRSYLRPGADFSASLVVSSVR